MKSTFRALLAAVIVSSVLVAPLAVRASSYRLNPVTITLSSTSTTSLVTVTNDSPEALRFQVTGFAWAQKLDGTMDLQPSNDIVYYPSMLKLAPGESRKVRVGMNATPGQIEKTYRIFIEELPTLVTANEPASVKVLSKFGIPVFLAPPSAAAVPRVDQVTVAKQALKFSVGNGGAAHLMEQKIKVTAKDGAGKAVWTKEMPGWYVLANGAREHDLALPPEACAAQSIVVEVETDTGAKATSAVTNLHCTP